ncbi:DUF1810 domain-containing protein [Neorhizobium sp. JUb45]|uniref:DUF1810 domain-containing protein n=1 Tax=unclassified Neorhizobium TaxID=2629175 RepID=UPI0010533608|nr:DUF1810 domain-containing protein [Neorhizobium sp. JUb45]TCR06548.1 uncharacterized protein (DUF1810 family) [Neorhizobium sp. JUb45]
MVQTLANQPPEQTRGSQPSQTQWHDDFYLGRFLAAQQAVYPNVLEELRDGFKQSHWMWFIFPQAKGLGRSPMAQRYGIASRAEAEAYLADPILGARLAECTQAMLSHPGRSAHDILGSPDNMKFCSSMTLFAEVANKGSPFEQALEEFCDGKRDERTLAFLN